MAAASVDRDAETNHPQGLITFGVVTFASLLVSLGAALIIKAGLGAGVGEAAALSLEAKTGYGIGWWTMAWSGLLGAVAVLMGGKPTWMNFYSILVISFGVQTFNEHLPQAEGPLGAMLGWGVGILVLMKGVSLYTLSGRGGGMLECLTTAVGKKFGLSPPKTRLAADGFLIGISMCLDQGENLGIGTVGFVLLSPFILGHMLNK